MRIIISPAKRMLRDTDALPPRNLPALLDRAQVLADYLRGLSLPALKKLLACNERLAAEAYECYQSMDLRRGQTPALLAYQGIQYRYMAPAVFTDRQFAYAEEHLRILSGLYGVLRPFDGVVPYRLELQAKLKTPFCQSLYGYWRDALFASLEEREAIVNLASEEYAKAVRPYAGDVRWVTAVFGALVGEKVVEKGVYVKMARGEMVRFLAEREAQTPEDMREFDRLGYRFCPPRSDADTYTFLKEH